GRAAYPRHGLRSWDDRATRGGPRMLRPAEAELQIPGRSDTRKSVQLNGSADRTHDEYGGGAWTFATGVSVSSPRWNLSLGPALSTGRIAAQYVGTVGDSTATVTYGPRYLFAPLDFTQVSAEVRLHLALAPRLALP